MFKRTSRKFLDKSIGLSAIAVVISTLQACGGAGTTATGSAVSAIGNSSGSGNSSNSASAGGDSSGSNSAGGNSSNTGSTGGNSSNTGSTGGNTSGSGSSSGSGNTSGSGTSPDGTTQPTPVPVVPPIPVDSATRFNIRGANVLYTTALPISSTQLSAGLMRSEKALPTFVSGTNSGARNGMMAGLAGNSSAFNLVSVTNDGISHQAIESPYLNHVLYAVSPNGINQTDERRFIDPNVYLAFSSDRIEGDSNDYSQFILRVDSQPCALYYVNTNNNAAGCALPNVEPIPYFGTDFGKMDGSNRKPLQFDSEGNIYVVGKPFTVSNNKIVKKANAVLYKLQRGTFAARALTQDNESVSFFTVLSSGEPVVAISRETGFDLAVFVNSNGSIARRSIATQIAEPFINLDTYRTLFYGSSAGTNRAVNVVRTSDSGIERAALDYNNGTPANYNLTADGTTYTGLVPRRVIAGDDGNYYTVYSATTANSDNALLIYQTLPFKRNAVAVIPVTGEWWKWMKNRPLQIKRGILYYATTQDRPGIGEVDIIKVVRLSDGTKQSLFGDRNYRIDSWKALGDTLYFSGIDNDRNQVVQGQVHTRKIAQQQNWSAAAWQSLVPSSVTPTASATASSIEVQDLESLAPQQPQNDTGMKPVVFSRESTDKAALFTFSKYMSKMEVESMLSIRALKNGTAAPAIFQLWGYQNLFLIYDSNVGLGNNLTSGLPAGSGSYVITSKGADGLDRALPDAYGWSADFTDFTVSESLGGTYTGQ